VRHIIIDTNVLISFVTARNPEQQSFVTPIFVDAAKAVIDVICPDHVLAEFVYVMDRIYGVSRKDISAMMRDFIAMPGVRIVSEFSYDLLFQLWPGRIAEYGDAVIAATAKGVKGAVVATFDKKLIAALKTLNIPLHIWQQ